MRLQRGRPLIQNRVPAVVQAQNPVLEQLPERGPKHPVHAAVQDKIDGAVDQRQNVHDLPVRLIALQKQVLPFDPDQKPEDALRELCYQKEEQHRHQHLGGAICPPFRFGNFPCHVLLDFFERDAVVAAQIFVSLFGFEEGVDEPEADDGEDAAWEELNEDGVDPEIDLEQGLVLLEYLVQVDAVQGDGFVVFYDGVFGDGGRDVGGSAEDGGEDVAEGDGESAAPL